MENTKKSELKETLSLLKDVGVHFILEGRKQTARGLENLADKVDINAKQESFINQVHQKLNNRKAEKFRNRELKAKYKDFGTAANPSPVHM